MLFVGTSIIHPSTEGVFLLCNILDLLIYSLKHAASNLGCRNAIGEKINVSTLYSYFLYSERILFL